MKLLDESASVKELPKQENIDEDLSRDGDDRDDIESDRGERKNIEE